jgi:chaperonin GroEL
MKKIIHKGKDARDKLRVGINFAADAVAFTLGPKGRNVSIARQSTSPKITNDGSTILQAIKLDDETEQMGVDFIKEASRLTELEAYDGTTSVSLITRSLINTCLDKIDSDSVLSKNKISPMALKEEINNAAELVVAKIKEKSKPISKREDILKASMVSVEDKKLAEVITNVFMEIGKDGIIVVEEGEKETKVDIVKGIEIHSGLHSEHYGDEIIVNNAKILVSLTEINDITKIVPIMNKLVDEGVGELVIFAKSFSKEILEIFTKMRVSGEFTVLAVRTTIPDKNYQLYDMASFTGAKVFDDMYHKLGSCKKFKITKDKSLFISGEGDTKEYIVKIEEELKAAKTEFDKENIQKRLSSLTGGVAVISVGAPSQVERGYLQDKLEDAVQSVRGAIRDGVVAGRGITLKEISEELPENILTSSLCSVYRQIQENGVTGNDSDIIDGVPVVVSCVRNACSVAGIVITTEMTIAIQDNENTQAKDRDIDA